MPELRADERGTGGASRGHVLVCPRRVVAPLELVLPPSVAVELAFADQRGEPSEGDVLLIDPRGWPLEPAFEAHLADQASPERGRLLEGRARFRLVPGPHRAVLVRGARAREELGFEVVEKAGDEVQRYAFTVSGGG